MTATRTTRDAHPQPGVGRVIRSPFVWGPLGAVLLFASSLGLGVVSADLPPAWRPWLTVVGAVLGVASPILAGDVVNAIVGGQDAPLIVRLALLIALVAVLDAAPSVFTKWLSSGLGERVIYDLRTAVFDHVQRMPLAVDRRSAGPCRRP